MDKDLKLFNFIKENFGFDEAILLESYQDTDTVELYFEYKDVTYCAKHSSLNNNVTVTAEMHFELF